MPPQTDQEREQRLDEVLASYLRARKEGATPDRQELLASYPELADELAAFFADQDRFDRLAAPLRALTPPPRLGDLGGLRDFGDYEIIEEIARGGMGVVFKARQRSLGRVVALKMLLAGPWASAADLQRFRAEAEAAAQLDHPNIVPIHEVGTHDGRPYLSMKLVEGGSLAHCLAASGRRPSGHEAAWLTATVADAIHYAHQRGILHRDLKPANILLARQDTECAVRNERHEPSAFRILHPAFCVPMVTDFGLAKRTPRPSCPETPLPRGALSEAATLPFPQVLTHTGAIVGTPGYMAPEQACGSPAAVTTAADVYGLGAVLYEMLTGRPPFKGATPLDTVRQLLEQEPDRPSVHNLAVDRDVETICLKCLQKEPSRRYASARDLADDLRRYLGGESILARPVGPLARTWRRARRQPIIAALTLALVLVVLGGLSGVTLLWLRAENNARRADQQYQFAEEQRQRAEEHFRKAEQQRIEADKAKEQAEENRRDAERHLKDSQRSFRLAHQAVHDFCRRVSDQLQDAPHLQSLRKSLLQSALNYYQTFLRQRGQDPALRRELAETYSQMGRLTVSIGSRTDTRAAFREAAALFRELQQADPDNVELQRKYGDALNAVAIFEDSSEVVFARLDEACDVYRRFLNSHPDDYVLRAGLAVTLSNRGLACKRIGRTEEAADAYRQARDLLEQLLTERPNDTGIQADLASVLTKYGVLCNRTPEGREDALQALRHVLELRAALAQAQPRAAHRRADLAAAHQELAIVLRDAGRQKEALHEFQQAHEIREKLARDNPNVLPYQFDLASSLTDLGAFHHHEQKRLEPALECFTKARDIYAKLFGLDPDSPYVRSMLAQSCFRVGIIQGALDRRSDEYQSLTRARDLQEVLIKIDPSNLDYRRDLSRTLNNLGQNRMAVNHPEETPPLLHEALEHMSLILRRAPGVPAYRETINFNWGTLAEAENRLGHTRAAADALRERAKLWPDNPKKLYNAARDLMLVSDRIGSGKTELTPDEQAERRSDIEDALTLLRQAISHGFRDVARLQKDKAFDSLRSHDTFRALVRDLEKQTPVNNNPNAPDMTKRK